LHTLGEAVGLGRPEERVLHAAPLALTQRRSRSALNALTLGADVPGPIQLRQQEKREEKLRDIREQVALGKLVIRQMTPDERRRFPPRDPRAPRAVAKRR